MAHGKVAQLATARLVAAGGADPRWRGNPSLRDVVEVYTREALPHLAGTTLKSHRWHLRELLARLPSHPTPGDVRKVQRELREEGYEASTVNVICKTGARAYAVAQSWAFVASPFARGLGGVPKLREAPPRPRAILDPDRTLPAILRALPDLRARAFVLVLVGHGLRKSEALGLEPRHLDMAARRLSVMQSRKDWTAKPGPLKHDAHAASLPLDPTAAEALTALQALPPRKGRLAAARFVFPYYTHELEAFMAAIREVAPGDFQHSGKGDAADGWHVFRHTFATRLLAEGARPSVVQRMLRHATLRETHTYIADLRGKDDVASGELDGLWSAPSAELLAALDAPGGHGDSVGTCGDYHDGRKGESARGAGEVVVPAGLPEHLHRSTLPLPLPPFPVSLAPDRGEHTRRASARRHSKRRR